MKLTVIQCLRLFLFVVAITATYYLATDAHAQVIYQDNFDGASSNDLGGTIPDISLTGDGWVTATSRQNGAEDEGARQVFNADGSINKVGADNFPQYDAGAVLPFMIRADTVYTLEATIFNNSAGYVAVGFNSSDFFLDQINGRHTSRNPADFGGYAFILTENNNQQQFFNGIGNVDVSLVGTDSVVGDVDVKIVLDTSDINAVTAEYFLNGNQIGGTQTLNTDAFTNISFISISSNNDMDGLAAGIRSLSFSAESDVAIVLGDTSGDGVVDFLDIASFVTILTTGDFQLEADIDGSGFVDFLDIVPFVQILTGG